MENPDHSQEDQSDNAQTSPRGLDNREGSFEGFAQAVSALEKLNRLESDIATIISSFRVPLKETRKFLRCTTPAQVANISLFQYMRALFIQLGIDIEITQIEPYAYYFHVEKSAISDLYSGTRGHTCHLVSEAISRFFNRDLNLGCNVIETKCVNAGDGFCEFKATVDKEDYCKMTLSDDEKRMLKDLEDLGEGVGHRGSSGVPEGELEFCLVMFKRLDLVDENGRITELGVKCSSQSVEEEDFDTPWKDFGDISSAISSAVSFAEASHLSIAEETKDASYEYGTPDQKEVRGYRSFAELLAKQVHKESKSEGF